MLYCDLASNGVTLWSGIPCLNGVGLKPSQSIDFSGNLFFSDALGTEDPTFDLLGTRFQLLFLSDLYTETVNGLQLIPLQAVASQTLQVVLDLQNCQISIYERGE